MQLVCRAPAVLRHMLLDPHVAPYPALPFFVLSLDSIQVSALLVPLGREASTSPGVVPQSFLLPSVT